MSTRAYRPEAPGCLEDRSLLSGVAGLSAGPVVLTHSRLNLVAEQMVLAFYSFGRDRDVTALNDDLRNVAVMIPFGVVDGLGVSINGIVDTMQHDIAANVSLAVRTARAEVIAVTLAEVQARVQAGDVVVR